MGEEPYKSTPKDRQWAWVLGIIHVALAILLAAMLFKIWPPTPWPSDKDLATNPTLAKAFADSECATPTPSPTAAVATSSSAGSQASSQSGATVTPPTAASPVTTTTPTPRPTPSVPLTGTQVAATPTPTPTPVPTDGLVSVPIKFWGRCYPTSFDERLILLVIVAGILGSFVHGATSLADFIGNDKFNKNWTWFYLLRPAIGMSLALVFYFVVRGGFLTTSGGAKDINPYGIAALAGLVGMFSKQATDKLSEVFSTLFRSAAGGGDDKRSGSLKTVPKKPGVTDVNPSSMQKGTTKTVTVTGTDFVDKCKIVLGETDQETMFESATKVTATITGPAVAKDGTLKLKVVNPDGTESPTVNFIVTP